MCRQKGNEKVQNIGEGEGSGSGGQSSGGIPKILEAGQFDSFAFDLLDDNDA